MKRSDTIEIIESFLLTNRGVIVDIRHELDGIPAGSIIRSFSSGDEWAVKHRILFSHVHEKQRKFPNEAVAYTHLEFKNFEAMESSAKRILDQETQNIFEYFLETNESNTKPVKGDKLVIQLAQ